MFQGKFVWYELMTTDTKASEAFYRDVVGWTAADSGMAGPPYTMLSAGDTMVGGLMELPEHLREAGAHPAWLGYIAIDDVDAGAAQVRAAGGSVHRGPADIPGVGRFAVVADPQGGVFVLFRGGSEAPTPPAPGTPGTAGWHELQATDPEAAFAFYSGVFGWTKGISIDMGPMGPYRLFGKDGVDFGGMMKKVQPMVPVAFWTYYFNVPDIKAAVAKVTEGGGQVVHGPTEVPGGMWVIQCFDPQGAMFALVAPSQK
jgi:predicted enzyme related to lactoylglutathione lyase